MVIDLENSLFCRVIVIGPDIIGLLLVCCCDANDPVFFFVARNNSLCCLVGCLLNRRLRLVDEESRNRLVECVEK